MKDRAPLSLLSGRTTHVRFVPFERRFAYPVLMVDIDVDHWEAAGRQTAAFSTDGAGLFSLRRKDHGAYGAASLRDWAAGAFAPAGVDLAGKGLRLVTFPRHLAYRFAPLSLWIAEDQDGRPAGILYEVNNTFGERHTYAAAIGPGRQVHEAEKVFHVSPFFDVSGHYRFTLRLGEAGLKLVIDTLQGETRQHMATITLKRKAATTGAFLKAALARPLNSIGVTAGIHWEAFCIWRRGARYHARPALPPQPTTIARPAGAWSTPDRETA